MTPSLVASLVGTLILTIVHVALYREYRERYLAVFAASWAVYSLQGLVILAAGPGSGPSPVVLSAYHATGVVSGALMFYGVHVFLGRAFNPLWIALFVPGILFTAAAPFFGLPFVASNLPVYLFLGAVYIWTGVSFLRLREIRGPGRHVAGWAFVLWGIHKVDYPFLRPLPEIAPWGFLLTATLALVAALGVILLYLYRDRAELSRNASRFRLLADNARDIVFRYVFSPTPRFEYVSPSITAITGYSPEEYYADPLLLTKIVHPEDRALLDTVRKSTRAESPELRWVRKDGEVVWIELRHVPIPGNGARVAAIEGIARDITERKKLEDQLRQSQKMEAIGRLAGGVAHDFNNLLTAINGYSDLLLAHLDPVDPRRRDVEEIRKAGERASSLTRQLLAFSRRQVLQPKVLDINEVVANPGKMLRRLIGEHIELRMDLAPDAGRVKADPGQIEQVIVNLALNARDAMPEGGVLAIRTEAADGSGECACGEAGTVPGRHVAIRVSDSGCGMDGETLSHLFEPFFTTKEVGKGTGLGLATVYGIVKQSGGVVSVDSAPGRGTTFRICLPQAGEETEALSAGDGSPRAPGGLETILVVEDEEVVRTFACAVLRRNGYTVLEASCGDEALALCALHVGPIHLALTDVVMPRMNGRELAEQLWTLRPGMTVLFVSGYTTDEIVHRGVLGDGMAFLPKPFTPDLLSRRVREVLDAG